MNYQMNTDEEHLLQALHGRDALVKRPAFMKRSQYRFVIDYGHWFKPTPLPIAIDHGDEQQCFMNALDALEYDNSLIYVEGFALSSGSSLPIHHAWITDGSGRALDNTWVDPGVAYAGVPFRTEFLIETILKNEAILSLLDDWQNNWPILGSLGDTPCIWLETRGEGQAAIDHHSSD